MYYEHILFLVTILSHQSHLKHLSREGWRHPKGLQTNYDYLSLLFLRFPHSRSYTKYTFLSLKTLLWRTPKSIWFFFAHFMYRMQQVTRIEISKTFTGNHQNAQREVEYRTRLSQLLSSDICSISFSSGCVGVCFGVLCLCFALCSLLFSPHFSPFSSLSYKGLASLHFMCLLLLSEKGVRWALGGGKSTHTDTKKKKKRCTPHFGGVG